MGWSEGKGMTCFCLVFVLAQPRAGLGKEETGSKAPINVVMREERAGLGSGTVCCRQLESAMEMNFDMPLQNVAITGDNVISASDSYADAVRKRARARYASE